MNKSAAFNSSSDDNAHQARRTADDKLTTAVGTTSQGQPFTDVITQTLAVLVKQGNLSVDNVDAVIVTTEADTDSLKSILASLPQLPSYTWQHYDVADFNDLAYGQRYDLAILIIGSYDDQAQTAIQRCRDLFARHTLVASRDNNSQQFTGLGFSRFSNMPIKLDKTPYWLWQFNLFDYKQLPDWFNSRFWANPENWDKFRW